MSKRYMQLPQPLTLFAIVALISWNLSSYGADEAVLKPRVPMDQIETVKTWTNPLPATDETIEKGKNSSMARPSA